MPLSVYLRIFVVTFLWGTAFPVGKLALAHAGPLTLAGLRFTVAGALLLCLSAVASFAWRKNKESAAAVPADWLRILKIAILSTAAFYGFFFLGMSKTSAASTAAVDAAGPIISAVMAHFVLHDDRLTSRRMLAILIAFVGILGIALSRGGSGPGAVSIIGCSLILTGLVFSAAGTMLVITYRGRYTLERLTGCQQLIGGALLLVVALAAERPFAGKLPDGRFAAMLLWLSLVSAVAFRIWYGLVRQYKIGSLSVFSFMTGLWGVILSAAVLKDPITPQFAMGLVAVIAGVLIMRTERSSHERSDQPAEA
jgi:drug/metabolite transporter (DMT)-like permease